MNVSAFGKCVFFVCVFIVLSACQIQSNGTGVRIEYDKKTTTTESINNSDIGSEITLLKNEMLPLHVQIHEADEQAKTVDHSRVHVASQDTQIVEIKENTLIAKNEGVTNIVITTEKTQKIIKIHVKPNTIKNIITQPSLLSIPKGVVTPIKVFAVYLDDSKKEITSKSTFYVKEAAGVTVSNQGLVQAKSLGETMIHISYDHHETYLPVEVVKVALLGLNITSEKQALPVGVLREVQAIGKYADGREYDLTSVVEWSSSDASIATITHENKLLAESTGNVEIAALYDGISTQIEIEINDAKIEDIYIDQLISRIPIESSLKLSVMGLFSNGKVYDVTSLTKWQSLDENIVTIEKHGLLKSYALGGTILTASVNGQSELINVAVFDDIAHSMTIYLDQPEVGSEVATSYAIAGKSSQKQIQTLSETISDILIEFEHSSIAVGVSQKLSASVVFSSGRTQDITKEVSWSSSNPDIASINEAGVLHGKSTGNVMIEASLLGVNSIETIAITDATLQAIDIRAESIDVASGYSLDLSAYGLYSDSTEVLLESNVYWTVDESEKASISQSGRLFTHDVGLVKISVFSGAISHNTYINITEPVLTNITLELKNQDKPLLAMESAIEKINVVGLYSDGSSRYLNNSEIQWAVSEQSRIRISPTGLLSMSNVTTGRSEVSVSAYSIQSKNTLMLDCVLADNDGGSVCNFTASTH